MRLVWFMFVVGVVSSARVSNDVYYKIAQDRRNVPVVQPLSYHVPGAVYNVPSPLAAPPRTPASTVLLPILGQSSGAAVGAHSVTPAFLRHGYGAVPGAQYPVHVSPQSGVQATPYGAQFWCGTFAWKCLPDIRWLLPGWHVWLASNCTTDLDYPGRCFKDEFECSKRGGTADGTCADGHGICCDFNVGGSTEISESGEYFMNKGHPETDDKVDIKVATLLIPDDTVQVKLDFENFYLAPPVEGECNTDTFVFRGANPGLEIPILCGYNSGQHMYIDVHVSGGPYKLIVTTSAADFARIWKIKVSFLTISSVERAPFRCLQFYPEESGEVLSFNYNPDGDSMMLNNQLYTICWGYVKEFCDILFTSPRFDLGPISGTNCGDRYLRVGFETYCGDTIGMSVRVNATATGPITAQVSADDDNSNEEEGFITNYSMMVCEW